MARKSRVREEDFVVELIAHEDGCRQYQLNRDGSSAAYYRSGQLAVSVVVVPSGNMVTTLLTAYEDNNKGMILASFDHLGNGTASENGRAARKFIVVAGEGGTLVDSSGSTVPPLGSATAGNKEHKNAWGLPLVLNLNSNLTFTYSSAKHMVLNFRQGSWSKNFNIIQGGTLAAIKSFTSSEEKKENTASGLEATQHLSHTLGTRSSKELDVMLSTLTEMRLSVKTSFPPISYPRKDPSTQSLTYQRSKSGLSELAKTIPFSSSAACLNPASVQKEEERYTKILSMGERQTKKFIADENPPLFRGPAIRGASGQYSSYIAPPSSDLAVEKLPLLTATEAAEWQSQLSHSRYQNTLLCVACLADWNPASRDLRQMMEIFNGKMCLAKEGTPLNALHNSVVLLGADISESKFLHDKYNLWTTPALLFFYNGKLVDGTTVGGLTLKARKRPPKVLLATADPRVQLRIEKSMAIALCEWDLVSGKKDMTSFMTKNNAYGILAIDLDLPPEEVVFIYDSVRKPGKFTTGSGGKPYVIGFVTGSIAGKNLSKDFAIPLNETVANPVASRSFMRAYDIAKEVVEEGEGELPHTGMSPADLAETLLSMLERAKLQKFAPANFAFSAAGPVIVRTQQSSSLISTSC